MYKSVFVTGTDTKVGKTVAVLAIMQALAKTGRRVAGFKPIASGSIETLLGLKNQDALHLQENANIPLLYEEVNPCLYHAECSPHIAARLEGKEIDFKLMSNGLKQLEEKTCCTLVEGVGGWRVPLSEHYTLANWVENEKLPVVLVVGIRVGCLNHASLTAEIIRHDGLEIIGWVANRISPKIEHCTSIINTLEQQLKVPKLGEIPYLPNIKYRDLSHYINLAPLYIPKPREDTERRQTILTNEYK